MKTRHMIALSLSLALAGCGFGGSTLTVSVNDPAPDFTARDLAGRDVTLAEHRGKNVVVLDFWASWCGPCQVSMPMLQGLHQQLGGRGLKILSLNQGEEVTDVRQFINDNHYSFHVLLDPKGEVGNKYGVRGIPTMVVVDKQGIVRRTTVGFSEGEATELRALVEKLLQE